MSCRRVEQWIRMATDYKYYVFPLAVPLGIHTSALRLQIPYTLNIHDTTIIWSLLSSIVHNWLADASKLSSIWNTPVGVATDIDGVRARISIQLFRIIFSILILLYTVGFHAAIVAHLLASILTFSAKYP